jgi:alpha-L-fucosidase 2
MYTTLAFEASKLELQHRLSQPVFRVEAAPRRRAGRRGLLAAILTAAAIALVPAVADAQTLDDVAINTAASMEGQVLDVAGASRAIGAPVIQWYSNGGANQRWNLIPDPNGYEHIVNVNSGLCLATNGQAGNYITQWPCSNSPQEDWSGSLFSGAFSNRRLQNPASGLYLSVNGDSGLAGTQVLAWYGTTSSWDRSEYFSYTQY